MNSSRRGFLRSGLALGAAKALRISGLGSEASGAPLFLDVPPSSSGIEWVHENAMSPSRFWKPSKTVRNALYRNNRDGTFTDVTEKAGVAGAYFGMGAAVGDYDNDGWPDIFVTAYGKCILYKNNHDGTFTDVTEKAGVATPGWTTSAVWFDYDNDGRLDLFVCSF